MGYKCFLCGHIINNQYYSCCPGYPYCEKCKKKDCAKCNNVIKQQYLLCNTCGQDKNLERCNCCVKCDKCRKFKSLCDKCGSTSGKINNNKNKQQKSNASICKCKKIICTCFPPLNNNTIKKQKFERCDKCRVDYQVDTLYCNSFCGHYVCKKCWMTKPDKCEKYDCRVILDKQTGHQFFKTCMVCFSQLNNQNQKTCKQCNNDQTKLTSPKKEQPLKEFSLNRLSKDQIKLNSGQKTSSIQKTLQKNNLQNQNSPNNNTNFKKKQGYFEQRSLQKKQKQKSIINYDQKINTYLKKRKNEVAQQCKFCRVNFCVKYLREFNCPKNHKICLNCTIINKNLKNCEYCSYQQQQQFQKKILYQEYNKSQKINLNKNLAKLGKQICLQCNSILKSQSLFENKGEKLCKYCCIKIQNKN